MTNEPLVVCDSALPGHLGTHEKTVFCVNPRPVEASAPHHPNGMMLDTDGEYAEASAPAAPPAVDVFALIDEIEAEDCVCGAGTDRVQEYGWQFCGVHERVAKLRGYLAAAPDAEGVGGMKQPSIQLLSKIGSIIVHADEFTSPGGHQFDVVAMRQLIADPEVQEWIKEMGPFLPVKRTQDPGAREKELEGH